VSEAVAEEAEVVATAVAVLAAAALAPVVAVEAALVVSA
jgi:hypothetical protein